MKIVNKSGDRDYFTIIPNYILNHSTMWDREVYIQMKRIAGDNGTCWASQKTLSKQCGMSINRLKKSINYLIKHKWIELVGEKKVESLGGKQATKEYRIIDIWNLNHQWKIQNNAKGVSSNDIPLDKGVSPDDTKGYHQMTKGVSPDDDKEEPYNKNHKNKRENTHTSQPNKKDFKKILQEALPHFQEKVPEKILKEEAQKFILYWTEKNPNGKKEKWEMQQTFDVKRRLATWLKNTEKWGKQKLSNKPQIIL